MASEDVEEFNDAETANEGTSAEEEAVDVDGASLSRWSLRGGSITGKTFSGEGVLKLADRVGEVA